MKHRDILGEPHHIRGWRASAPDHRDKLAAEPPLATLLPKAVDLTDKCPPIRDQKSIGSCTANSSLEAMGFLYTKAGKTDPQLSRLFTYYYSRKMEGTAPTEDAGAQIRDVMKCLALYGSCYETTWPYVESRYSAEPPHRAVMEARDHQALMYFRCPSLRTIKASIAQGFPVVGGFSCPNSMFEDATAKTGVIAYPGPAEGFEGGHAVMFMAYNDDTELLKFQNSWGPHWGDKGFGYLPYKFVTAGLADDFWTIRREEM